MAEVKLPPLVWRPSPNFSSREGKKITGIVIHETEGAYAGAVSWFEQGRSQVSAHFVVNESGAEVTQLVVLGNKAWHATNANGYTVGIELAGEKANPLNAGQITTAAYLAAYLCHRFGIKPAYTKNAVGGIATHHQLGAFGGGHLDPDSANWSDSKFIDLVATTCEHDSFPAVPYGR